MSSATELETRQCPVDVTRSLFWDDVRTGLKVASVGIVVLLIGELVNQYVAHGFVGGIFLILGAALTVIGLGICTAIPKDTGTRPWAIATALLAAVGALALVIWLFSEARAAGILAVLLAGFTLILLAMVLRGATTYIGHRPLMAAAGALITSARAFAILLTIVALWGPVSQGGVPLGDIMPVRLLADLLAIGMVGMTVYLAWNTSEAILRARLGHPLELPRLRQTPEYLAAEEARLARENVTYVPPPPPHFNENEVRYFHADDTRAASAIVYLMAGIFTVGVVLYLVVAWSVVS
jgi:hypothetical protein